MNGMMEQAAAAPQDESDALGEGIALYNDGKASDALAFFLALPQDTPADEGELSYYLGLCCARLGRYDDALEYLEQVVTSGGASIGRALQCRFLLAVIYTISGRKRLAEFEISKLLESGWRPSSVYAASAYLAWERREVDKCIEWYEKSLQADPDNLTALNGLGYVLACENRDLARALSLCKKAVDANPKSSACLDSLGWVYFKLGMTDEAERCLGDALKNDESSAIINDHLAQAKAQKNQR